MYLEHFGLRDKPFRIPPSPRLLYPSETHDEGRARILYGIRENRGFVVVTGAVGLGKTTVLLSVLDEFEEGVRSALIFNPVEGFDQLLRMICLEFGVDVRAGEDEVAHLHALNRWLVERYAEGVACVLLIDEAQNLPLGVLERLRMLSNLQTEEASLLQIVLVGQPELYVKMMDVRLVQLRQRVGVWHEIQPLGKEDTVDYIAHRLRMCGSPRPREIFSPEQAQLVHALSGGVPRLINQICDTALVIAFGRTAKAVEAEHVREAAAELRLAEPPTTPEVRESVPANRPKPTGLRASTEPALAPPLKSDRSGRPFLVAAIAVALLALAAWGATRTGMLQRVAALWSEAEESAAASAAPIRSEGVQAAVPSVAVQSPDSAAVARALDGQRLAATWRSEGKPVYSVHLGSFERSQNALRYAHQLLQPTWRWQEGVYIDSAKGWHRVLAGGFLDPAEARIWIQEIRNELGVDYAQVVRLEPTAVAVLSEQLADLGGLQG